jgi:hypothetical protein
MLGNIDLRTSIEMQLEGCVTSTYTNLDDIGGTGFPMSNLS